MLDSNFVISVGTGTAALWGLSRWIAGRFAREDGIQLPPARAGSWVVLVILLAFWMSNRAASEADAGLRLIVATYLALSALVDKWSGYIPDTGHLIAAAAVAAWKLHTGTFSAWSLATGLGLALIIAVLSILCNADGIGGGDVKLAAILGFALGFGPAGAVYWMGNLFALTQALFRRKVLRLPTWPDVRMGPFFLLGYAVLLATPVHWLPSTLQMISLP